VITKFVSAVSVLHHQTVVRTTEVPPSRTGDVAGTNYETGMIRDKFRAFSWRALKYPFSARSLHFRLAFRSAVVPISGTGDP
jgi:hypothetical protein